MTSDANSLAKAALERVLAVTCGQIQLSRRAEQRLRFRVAVAGRVRALAYSVEGKLAKFRVLAQPSTSDRNSCCLRISTQRGLGAARGLGLPPARPSKLAGEEFIAVAGYGRNQAGSGTGRVVGAGLDYCPVSHAPRRFLGKERILNSCPKTD